MGKWAVVTGASSGIGRDISWELARRSYSLFLVARSAKALEQLAEELRSAHAVDAIALPLDLSLLEAPSQLVAAVRRKRVEVEVLVNNAGVGYYGTFNEQDPARMDAMMMLNMRSVVMLTHAFAHDMAAVGRGYILQIASGAAFMPIPRLALYAASKAFVLQLSQALHSEFRRHGVRITTLCPGPTRTHFFEAAAFKEELAHMDAFTMSSQKVAAIGVKGMFAGKRVVIPGIANRFACRLPRFMPGELMIAAADVMMSGRGSRKKK